MNLATRVLRGLKRRSPIGFVRRVRRQQAHGWTPKSPRELGNVGDLQADGYLILPAVLGLETVAELRNGSRPFLAAAIGGEGLPHRYLTDGTNTAIVEQADVFCPTLVAVLRATEVKELASEAAGSPLRATTFRAELKTAANGDYPYTNDEVDVWHVDHWDVRTKAMVYLTDVGEQNAPLRYLTGSHHDLGFGRRWLVVHWIREYFMSVPKVSDLLAAIWARYAERSERLVKSCTGPAGTVVLFDTRGLHSGTALETGERQIFNVHYSPAK